MQGRKLALLTVFLVLLSSVPLAAAAVGTPTNLTATPGDRQVSLSWTAASNANGYDVFRGTSAGFSATYGTGGTYVGSSTTTSYLDTGLSSGVTYYYKVKGWNDVSSEEGPLSSEVSATARGPPGVPTGVSASGQSTYIFVDWSAPSSGYAPTIYKVYRGTSAGSLSLVIDFDLIRDGSLPTDWSDSTVTPGTTYHYALQAGNTYGESTQTSTVSAAAGGTPGAPTGLVATPSSGSVTLSWNAPTSDGGFSITNYKIYRGCGGPVNYLMTIGNLLTYSDTGLTNGVTCTYSVSAVNSKGEGPESSQASATPSGLPGQITDWIATGQSASVFVQWNAPGSNGGNAITQYRIYKGTSSSSLSVVYTDDLSTQGQHMQWSDTAVAAGTTYYYAVAAINGHGEGARSETKSAAVGATPSVPRNVAATPGNQKVTLTWDTPASDGGFGISSYNIYRGCNAPLNLYTTIGNVQTFTDTGLTNGVPCAYSVQAINEKGLGTESTSVAATPHTNPGVPTGVAVARGDRNLTISWTAPSSSGGSGILRYDIYRAQAGASYTKAGSTTQTSLLNTNLTNGQSYSFYVVAVNNELAESAASTAVVGTPGDDSPPGAPTALQIAVREGAVELAWHAPGDADLRRFLVYRNSALYAYATGTTYTDSTVQPGVRYAYYVSAEDTSGNEGNATNTLEAYVPVPGDANGNGIPLNQEVQAGNLGTLQIMVIMVPVLLALLFIGVIIRMVMN